MISPVYCMEDIVVPISNIPAALDAIEKIAANMSVKFHVLDMLVMETFMLLFYVKKEMIMSA